MPARRAAISKSVVLSSPEGRISGAANRLLLEGASASFGAASATRAARAAGGASAEGAWVPYATHLRLLDALADEFGIEKVTLLGRYNARNVERVVPGASFLLRFLSPERLLKEAPRIWGTYADFGRLVVVQREKGSAEIALLGISATPAFCASLTGFIAGLLERVGARQPTVRSTICVIDGAQACRFVGSWS